MMPYEIGPIRPPSESDSLLIRVSRNCPWNMCAFCKVYKGESYEARPVPEIIDDIQNSALQFQDLCGKPFESAFLQDADPIRLPTSDLILILTQLKKTFPAINRVTTYGRSDSIAKKSLDELKELYDAGLTRIHRGLETGYNALLKYMRKGATAELQIKGGQKVKEAGIELSDYVMPGLGGNLQLENQPTWKRHAEETARVLNEVDPDYIRLRTLAVHPMADLWQKVQSGEFSRLSDQDIMKEIRFFIENLNGISSQVESDHTLNVLIELRGRLPDDKESMLTIVDRYLNMSPNKQYQFRIGALLGRPNTLDKFEEVDTSKQLSKFLNHRLIGEKPLNFKKKKIDKKTQILLEEIIQGLLQTQI